MKVRIVGFQKTIGMPNFSNDRPLVVEADLEEGETMEQAWSKMNKAATDWHKAEYPNLYQENGIKQNGKEEVRPYVAAPGAPWGPAVVSVDKDNPISYLEAIQGAQSLEELKQYKLIAGTDQTKALYNAYNQRIKELSI